MAPFLVATKEAGLRGRPAEGAFERRTGLEFAIH
jgi:hypothetical protein